MNSNFKETYKSLSTGELLNIVGHPNDYQQEAVMTANELLKNRTITDADIEEADRLMMVMKDYWIDEKEALNNVSKKIENLLEPVVKPETTVNPKKWINILTVMLGIYISWNVINLIVRRYKLVEVNRLDHFRLFEIVQPVYLLLTIFGLQNKKKWGWKLLMIFFIVETLTFAIGSLLSINYSFVRIHLPGNVMTTFIYGGAVYFLSRNNIRTYFNISIRLLRNTVFSAIITFLLIQVYGKYFLLQ